MQNIINDLYNSFKKDKFFIIRILYAVNGLFVGFVYGAALSIPALFGYILISEETNAISSSNSLLGIPFTIIALGIFCSSLFFILFGNLNNQKIRIFFGILGGIVFGFLSASTMLKTLTQYGDIVFIIYCIFFATIGGFFVAKNSIYHCVKINNLSQTILNRFKIFFTIILLLILTDKFDITSKIKNYIKNDKSVYIIVKSKKNKIKAIQEANKWINLGYNDTEVLLTTNGYYAISLGYYNKEKAIHFKEQMIENKIIIDSAYLIGNKSVVSSIKLDNKTEERNE